MPLMPINTQKVSTTKLSNWKRISSDNVSNRNRNSIPNLNSNKNGQAIFSDNDNHKQNADSNLISESIQGVAQNVIQIPNSNDENCNKEKKKEKNQKRIKTLRIIEEDKFPKNIHSQNWHMKSKAKISFFLKVS